MQEIPELAELALGVRRGHRMAGPSRTTESSPTIFLVTADPEARGDQWRRLSGVYGNRGHGDGMHGDGMCADGTYAGRRGRGGRSRRAAASLALILGLVGFAVSATGVVIQLLPRQFNAAQQRQIEAWEVLGRWQTMPAGQIFPASVSYQLSAKALHDTAPLNLDALRVSIAPQESDCAQAVTSAVAGAVLRRNGCEAVLRATYVDTTRSYVMTVGVAVLPTGAAAASADSGLSRPQLAAAHDAGGGRLAAGVLVVRFGGAAARLYDYNRQIARSFTAGPYIVMYAVGYSDSRPRVPVSGDTYSEAEMTSMAKGVAWSVADTLATKPAPPHCPGAPGC
jgi:hypothetical protein